MAALLNRLLTCGQRTLQIHNHSLNFHRSFKRWVAPALIELARRKRAEKPKPPQRRSTYTDWNYKAELFAFGARLNEEFKEETLRVAFTHKSYIEAEEKKRSEVGLPKEQIALDLKDNDMLVMDGERIMDEYLKPFLRYCFPYLPEEGIIAIEAFLTSDKVLSHVASNIGVGELIFSADYPAEIPTLANTFRALIGGLARDKSHRQAELFLQDFLVTQLVGKDVNALWSVAEPFGTLTRILEREGRGLPEPRLIRETGCNTILAVYLIGIYSDKRFLGYGPGETVEVAEEEAARDCLKRFFETTEKQPSLPIDHRDPQVTMKFKPNLTLHQWTKQAAQSHAENV